MTTINTAEQLDALGPGAVVRDIHGDVWQEREGYWCSYEANNVHAIRLAEKWSPLTVLTEQQEDADAEEADLELIASELNFYISSVTNATRAEGIYIGAGLVNSAGMEKLEASTKYRLRALATYLFVTLGLDLPGDH